MRYGKCVRSLTGLEKNKIYKASNNGRLIDFKNYVITGITIIESTEEEYMLQEKEIAFEEPYTYCDTFINYDDCDIAWLEVIEDLKNVRFTGCSNIPNNFTKGAITWTFQKNLKLNDVYLIENNRYSANIPSKYFKRIDKPLNSFILPKKWCILQSNQKVCDWFNKNTNLEYTCSEGVYKYLCYNSLTNKAKYSHHNIYNNEEYTEITFEQFKNHVLKKHFIKDAYGYVKNYDSDIPEHIAELRAKHPYPGTPKIPNNNIVDLYIPEIKQVPVNVDYSVNVKLADIKLPDLSIEPEKIEKIKIDSYILNI